MRIFFPMQVLSGWKGRGWMIAFEFLVGVVAAAGAGSGVRIVGVLRLCLRLQERRCCGGG